MGVRHWLFACCFLLWMPIFSERWWWWSLSLAVHVRTPVSLCFTCAFQNQIKTSRWNKMTRKKKTRRCVVSLVASKGTNTNEAIWPERQVNEECWLKKRAECRIKALSCSLWAMLCADSCFNKTLWGGSGHQVASDKKPHNEKGRDLPASLSCAHMSVPVQTQTYQTHQTCACIHK